MVEKDQSQRVKVENTRWGLLAFSWGIGYSIVIPLVLGVCAGKVMDIYFHTSPFGLLFGAILSIFYSVYSIIQKTSAALKSIESQKDRPTKSNE